MPGHKKGNFGRRGLPDEPPGWQELQKEILQERDPAKLKILVRRMNELLTHHEAVAKTSDRGVLLSEQKRRSSH
jgi:hypothetical protein